MESIATLNQTVSRSTDEHDLLLAGLIHMSRGEDVEALAAFSSLLAANEPSSLVATCAAQLLLRRRDMKGAAAILLAATAREPELAEAHYLLGLAWRGMYRNFDALRCFRTALTLQPDNAEARMEMDELLNVQEP